MLLSIAMIVKNEEKNIERCLQAIKKLDNKISYEIVIVDTGSTDKTIEISKKYTDLVYEHKWNNNFADMRNKSIQYCKGEWILVLDADEVIENPEDVVKFFDKEGENSRCNCAVIQFKNMLSKDENNFLMGSLIRLFRNKKEFCYKGRVHEQPLLFAPIGYTNITLRHYGYSRENYELMKYKYERNLKLLLKDLKDGKDPIYTYFQLAQTYAMANREDDALESIKNAYIRAMTIDIKRYIYIIHFYARELLSRGNYEKTIELCDVALKYTDEHLDFYYMESISYKELKNYKKQKEYLDKYFDLCNKIKEGYIVKDISVNCFSLAHYSEALIDDVVNAYNTKKYKDISNLYNKIEKDADKDRLIEIYLYSLMKNEEIDEVKKYYSSKDIQDQDVTNIINVVNRIFVEESGNKIIDTAKKLMGIDEKIDIYIKSKYLNEKIDNYSDISFDKFCNWKSELATKIYAQNEEFLDTIQEDSSADVKAYIINMNKDYTCLTNLMNFSRKNFMTSNFSKLHLLVNIEHVLLSNKSIDTEEYNNLIQRSVINKVKYLKTIYNFSNINNKNAKLIFNTQDFVVYNIYSAIQACEDDKLEFINKLKIAVRNAPEYKKIIKYYLGSINDTSISDAMKNEKKNLINVIEQSIADNNMKQAQDILIELKKLFEYDYQVLNCDGVINYINRDYDRALISLGVSDLLLNDNFDTVYNIACVMEAEGRKEDAAAFYQKSYDVCDDDRMKNEILLIIKSLSEE